jgi:probable H4MPT-linked C1 transfer pathway protein
MSLLATGWDLGGAHLKVAQARGGGLVTVAQIACPLWQGLDRLTDALARARRRLGPSPRHAVTMTGELVDLFASRAEGVHTLVDAMQQAFGDVEMRFFAGPAGLVGAEQALAQPESVASANWLASAQFAAQRQRNALFLDVGSTTSDLLLIVDGAPRYAGYTDAARLVAEELVYTGVTRTPVMALARSVPFGDDEEPLMAELFATAADVHRLTGALPEDADQLPTADGRDKSLESSARRLARMLGRDCEREPADLAPWRRVAQVLSEAQLRRLHDAAARLLSRGLLDDAAPVLGAGVGRFLARDLAARLARPYVDFAALISGSDEAKEWAARCAPAAALAMLAAEEW